MRPSEVIVLRVRCFNKLVLAYTLSVVALLFGCGSEDRSREPAFLDSKETVDPAAEAERLRKLQAIKVELTKAGEEPREVEFSSSNLSEAVRLSCRGRFGSPNGICTFSSCIPFNGQCACHDGACESLSYLCSANALLDLAAPRTEPYSFEWSIGPSDHFVLESGEELTEGSYTVAVPPQSIAANAAMLRSASDRALRGTYNAAQGLTTCQSAHLLSQRKIEADDEPNDLHVVGEVMARSFAEGFQLYSEATAKAVDAIVSVADWQRSHPSLEIQINRAILGEQLSRAEAAHLLVGGQAGLQPSTDVPGASMGLCTVGELSGPAQRAVDAIRDAAVSPTLLIDLENTSIEELLGPGPGTVVNQLRALGKLGSTDGLAELLDELDLRKQDFVEARKYLVDEFVVYSRSLDPNVRVTAGRPAGEWYAATASPPPPREAAFYGAIARVPESPLLEVVAYDGYEGRSAADILEAGYFAQFVDTSIAVASQILATDYGSANAVIKPVLGNIVAEGRERVIGRWMACTVSSGNTWFSDVLGFSPEDGLIIVRGEEGMECGVQGVVEGAPCDLSDWIAADMSGSYFSPFDGFDSTAGTSFRPYGPFAPNFRLYLLKPRTPGGPVAAGQYTALAGVQVPEPTGSETLCVRVSLVPEAEERVAEILKPSRKWCSQSLVSCAGEKFDARLPLENELSDDQSGVENSWRRYLDLAKQAAAEADLLGQQFIDFGIQLDQREEELELREHAQEVAVLQELENLQTICGTSVDIQAINLDPSGASGQSCSASQACPAGYVCFSGKCAPDIEGQIESLAANDDQYQRLFECIAPSQEVPFVTPGDTPLKAWCLKDDPNGPCDPNTLCQGLPNEPPPGPCPVLAEQPLHPPGDTTQHELVEINTTLNYFRSNQAFRSFDRATCDDIRTLRDATDLNIRRSLLEKIKASNFFHPGLMVQVASRLGWEARLGGYGAVLFNGVPIFETGRLGVAEHDGWPCTATDPPIACPSGETKSLFCGDLSCVPVGTNPGLPFTNERLRNAIIALRLSLGMDLKGISFPLFMSPNYHIGHFIPAPLPYTRQGPGGIAINDFVYTNFESSLPATLSLPFGMIVRHDVDANIRVGWCWGPDSLCPGDQEQYVAWSQDASSVPNFDIAFSEIGDFMLDNYQDVVRSQHSELATLASEIPLVGGPIGDVLGELECAVFDCDVEHHFVGNWRKVFGRFDGNFWVWADLTKDSLFMRSANALDWFQSADMAAGSFLFRDQYVREAHRDLTAAIHDYLVSGVQKNVRFVDDFKIHSSTHPFPVVLGFEGLEIAERGIDLGLEQIIDGMELLCEVAAEVRAEPSCTGESAPEIRSPSDLHQASSHLQCMARELEGRLGHRVYAHFPQDAVDALQRESVLGSFPQVGGEIGAAISALRGALVELADVAPQVAGQLNQMARDIDAVRVAIERHEIAKQIAEVEFLSMSADRITDCVRASAETIGVETVLKPGKVITALATCANTTYQIILGERLESLKEQDADLAAEAAIIDFDSRFAERGEILERLATRANAAMEQIDAQLAAIENLRLRARRSLHRALYLNSFQAEKQMAINSSMRRRFNTSAIRYEKAFKNGQRLAFIAKLAVEQRLGMRLSSMHEKLPLVDAPNTWESSVCSMQGIDWSEVTSELTNPDADPNDPANDNFADQFIGDYVRNLENVVESYRMVHNFHEGLDTAVISLKDDVYRSRSICEVPSTNLLFHAGQLDQWKAPATSGFGWRLEGCATQMVDTDSDSIPDTEQPLPDCVDARLIDRPMNDVEYGSAPMKAYQFTFGPVAQNGQQATCNGCGLNPATRIVQNVELGAGDYLLSWYHQRVTNESGGSIPGDPHGGGNVKVFLEDGSPAPVLGHLITEPGPWKRSEMAFSVPSDQVVTVAIVPGAESAVPHDPHQVLLGGMMLEYGRSSASRFADTDETRTRRERACNDPTGTVFRKEFTRGCVKLCSNGFDGVCGGEDATEHCYRELNFNINQRDIESGRLLANTGFALGNFNYRIESVAVNFVGTGLRECASAGSPTSCNAQGYIPYTLRHAGPYFVRNHMGQDFKAELFTGHIEHARGLGSERYITNPIGSADRDLLAPYTRHEFQGRPLDGNFTLRVWDHPTVDFSKIEDIQIVLHYRYWTRFD